MAAIMVMIIITVVLILGIVYDCRLGPLVGAMCLCWPGVGLVVALSGLCVCVCVCVCVYVCVCVEGGMGGGGGAFGLCPKSRAQRARLVFRGISFIDTLLTLLVVSILVCDCHLRPLLQS